MSTVYVYLQGSLATMTARSSVFVEGTGSVLGKVKTVEMTDRPMTNLTEIESSSRPGIVTLLFYLGFCI